MDFTLMLKDLCNLSPLNKQKEFAYNGGEAGG